MTEPTDTEMLDFIASEYLDVSAFAMPTGGGDADVGWKLVQEHEGRKGRVEVAIHYRDDLREAIREAMKNLAWLKRTRGVTPTAPALPTVPEGYVLVPIKPTPAMVDVMLDWGTKRSEWEMILRAAQPAAGVKLVAPGNLGDPGMPTAHDLEEAFYDAIERVELTEEQEQLAREWFSVGALEFAARARADGVTRTYDETQESKG